MQAAQKKRLEEKNAKLIRELAALQSNRNCFECGQRGPTYVNVTEGSFCCTQCSGILRGLNPPHRVKSISMAAFTTEEVEKLRSLGNAENAKVWLGLYGGVPPAITNRDQVQAFLVKKYEKKTWYISRAEVSEQERLLNQANDFVNRENPQTIAPVASSSTTKPSELDFLSGDTHSLASEKSHNSEIKKFTSDIQAFSPPAWLAPPPPFSFDSNTAENSSHTANNGQADLLGLFTGPNTSSDQPPLFPPSAPNNVIVNKTRDPFADFDQKFNDLSVRPSATMTTISEHTNTGLPKSATVDSSFASLLPPISSTSNPFQVNVMKPYYFFQLQSTHQAASVNSATLPTTFLPDNIKHSNEGQSNDKYSALAELDELFHNSGPSNQASGKPAWMPSGFSTGIPPSATVNSFQQMTLKDTSRPISNNVGGFPKSQTMGSIADYGVNNPFLSSANCAPGTFPNPFESLPNQSAPMQHQWNMTTTNGPTANPAFSNTTLHSWNPFL